MSECKHDGDWSVSLAGANSGVVTCVQCGASIRGVLAAKDRQLDAAERDMCRHVSASCNVCPVYKGDMGGCLERPWRKRWEEMSK